MTIDEIIFKTGALKKQLHEAVATMERSDKVKHIREEIKKVQAQCPHSNEKFKWNIDTNKCPYCGYTRGE